jgi:4-alpha-glucanotransferase
MARERSSGILLHPTSLPGPYGIGDIGPAAERWVDWLAGAGCRYWQVLPLSPIGKGNSPYACPSAFAGNPLLVSPERLLEIRLLEEQDLADLPAFPDQRVDFDSVVPWKAALLDRAFSRFRDGHEKDLYTEWTEFREANEHWLPDYTLFAALAETHDNLPWSRWPKPLRFGEPEAVRQAKAALRDDIERHAFRQFLFFRQWHRLRRYANERGIEIIGDAPMYVSIDSADVWTRPELFKLDDHRRPTVVAGVPQDIFSATGQLWGHPIHDWQAHAAEGFAWWIERLRLLLELVDVIRIDHFRAFADYWEIPAGAATALTGRWVAGPGRAFFDAVRNSLGDVPIIAEDLGEPHPVVAELLEEVGLPGMKLLQAAFDPIPHNPQGLDTHVEDCVAYTGTHDNDTVVGWYRSLSWRKRHRVRRMLGTSRRTIAQDLVEATWRSPAYLAIAPIQDLLGLGSEARINQPGTLEDNWEWRMSAKAADTKLQAEVAGLNLRFRRSRLAGPKEC